MGWPVLVFDIETIPDVAGLRALGLGQSAEASLLPQMETGKEHERWHFCTP